jgi:uncharacterized RDD family membrane protein YckC
MSIEISKSINLLEDLEPNLVRASTGKRLANYIIDVLLFYIFMLLVGVLIGLFAPSLLNMMDDTSAGFNIVDRIVSLFLYALFMFGQEALLKGKSLGKLITGTKAVNYDGTEISINKAFLRGCSRAVPFCVFSALGTPCNPWQDKWTDTMVIDIKESQV